MKGSALFGLCFIGIISLLILSALAAGIICQFKKTGYKRFVKYSREKLHKRYPYLNPEEFTPVIMFQSPCCQKMLWLYDDKFILHYFCDDCGKRYAKTFDYATGHFTDELEYLECEPDLPALNELFKSWAE